MRPLTKCCNPLGNFGFNDVIAIASKVGISVAEQCGPGATCCLTCTSPLLLLLMPDNFTTQTHVNPLALQQLFEY